MARLLTVVFSRSAHSGLAGGSIRSITADPSNNIYFSDGHQIQRLTTTGVFQTVATPPTGFTPEEVNFKFNRLLFTYIANTGTAGKVGTLSGSTIHLFNVPSLSRGPSLMAFA